MIVTILNYLKLYEILDYVINMAAKGDWEFRISDLVKNPVDLIFNPCGQFR